MSKPPSSKSARVPSCSICRGYSGIASFVTCSACKVRQHAQCMSRAGGCGTEGCSSGAPKIQRLVNYAYARLLGETGLVVSFVLLASALAWLPVLAAWAPPACWIPGGLALLAMVPLFARAQVLKGEKSTISWSPLHSRIESWMERNPTWVGARLWFRRVTRLVVGADLALVLPALLCLAGAPMQATLFASLPGVFLAASYLVPHAGIVGGFLLAAFLPTFLTTLGIATPAAMLLAVVPGLLIARHAMPESEFPSTPLAGEGRPFRVGGKAP